MAEKKSKSSYQPKKEKVVQGHILYRIYYGDYIVYLGRTKQPLHERIRGHFFSKPMHRKIDIFNVSRIEYAELKSTADMYLYEVYYINKDKPMLNVDDRASDALGVTLPELKWQTYCCPLMDKWIVQLRDILDAEELRRKNKEEFEKMKRKMRRELDHDAYLEWLEAMDYGKKYYE